MACGRRCSTGNAYTGPTDRCVWRFTRSPLCLRCLFTVCCWLALNNKKGPGCGAQPRPPQVCAGWITSHSTHAACPPLPPAERNAGRAVGGGSACRCARWGALCVRQGGQGELGPGGCHRPCGATTPSPVPPGPPACTAGQRVCCPRRWVLSCQPANTAGAPLSVSCRTTCTPASETPATSATRHACRWSARSAAQSCR